MYKSLQAGRAIAAILVVLFHLGGAIAAEKYFGLTAFSIPFSFGDAGVEFFFVLSGFIIFAAHQKDISQPHKLRSYLRKRITRIYPTYWMIFLGVYFLAVAMSSALSSSLPDDVLVLLKSLLLLPQDKSMVGGTGAPILIVAWTLQYEMLFYLFFAVMILNRVASIVLGLVWFSVFISFSGSPSLDFPLSFIAKDYVFLFILGMVVAKACMSKIVSVKNPCLCATIGLLMFLSIALDEVTGVNFSSEHGTVLYGLASGLIIFGLVKAEAGGRVIGGNSWLQLIGDSSYALYLIHYPLISILCKIAIYLRLNQYGFSGALLTYVLILGSCIVSSMAFHLWIEKPTTVYIRNFFAQPKPVA